MSRELSITISFPQIAEVKEHLRSALTIMATAQEAGLDATRVRAAQSEIEEALEVLKKMGA